MNEIMINEKPLKITSSTKRKLKKIKRSTKRKSKKRNSAKRK